MARFYVEGDEVDVQDPAFYYPEEQAVEHYEAIAAYLSDYAY